MGQELVVVGAAVKAANGLYQLQKFPAGTKKSMPVGWVLSNWEAMLDGRPWYMQANVPKSHYIHYHTDDFGSDFGPQWELRPPHGGRPFYFLDSQSEVPETRKKWGCHKHTPYGCSCACPTLELPEPSERRRLATGGPRTPPVLGALWLKSRRPN